MKTLISLKQSTLPLKSARNIRFNLQHKPLCSKTEKDDLKPKLYHYAL